METLRFRLLQVSVLAGSFACILLPGPSPAETLQVPWECSNYTADAQTRCINVFMEDQQKKIEELEGKLQVQQSAVNKLKDQLDRQTTATTDLQRRLAEQPTSIIVPIPYSFPYSYSYPLGFRFGLHFGDAGIYAPPYYRPDWGPRHYGYWGYRW